MVVQNKKRNRIAFIVPYFGKFNNYFALWLKSCEFNSDIDWLLFTDDRTEYNYPLNVKVHYYTFSDTVALFQNRFEFQINLKTPYQLCEYKVAYGDIYSDFLEEYDFWGFCDVDLIWGNLKHYLTDEILATNHKISWRGHMSLFRNTKEINTVYKSKYKGFEIYKIVFSDPIGIAFAFDELWLNLMFEHLGYSIYKHLPFADLKIRSKTFELLHFPVSEDFKNKNQLFIWNKGKLSRIFSHNNSLFEEDFCYIHFLKRPMSVSSDFNLGDSFLISPNEFKNCVNQITIEEVINKTNSGIYFSYILGRMSFNYFFHKINYYLRMRRFMKQYNSLPSMFYEVIIPPIDESRDLGNKFSID